MCKKCESRVLLLVIVAYSQLIKDHPLASLSGIKNCARNTSRFLKTPNLSALYFIKEVASFYACTWMS